MIGLHPVHRRLAELTLKAQKLGGYSSLSLQEHDELNHCLQINLDIVRKLDSLKTLAFLAHSTGDEEWQQHIHQQIQEMEQRLK